MPARVLVCTNCGYELPTFQTDDELQEDPSNCPECGCPEMKIRKNVGPGRRGTT